MKGRCSCSSCDIALIGYSSAIADLQDWVQIIMAAAAMVMLMLVVIVDSSCVVVIVAITAEWTAQ